MNLQPARSPEEEDIARFEEVLRSISHALRAQFLRDLAEKNLSYSAAQVLFFAHQNQDITMGNIQKRLGLAGSTITGLVDTLDNKGLVERAPHPKDRRATVVRVTPKGKQEVNDLRSRRIKYLVKRWPNDVPQEGLQACLALLDRIADSL